jgi:hypothetical protein
MSGERYVNEMRFGEEAVGLGALDVLDAEAVVVGLVHRGWVHLSRL